MRGDALRERCRELHFRSASLGDLKGRYGETNFIEDVESAASALKEYGFWSLIRLLPLPEQELVRAEENPTRPDYRAARTPAELDELQNMVKAAEVCALDTEASDRDPRNAVLYGVAAAGKDGAQRALDILREEILRDLGLLGVRSIAELNPRLLVRLDGPRA